MLGLRFLWWWVLVVCWCLGCLGLGLFAVCLVCLLLSAWWVLNLFVLSVMRLLVLFWFWFLVGVVWVG